MKHIIIPIISLIVFGCSSANRNTSDTSTESVVVSSDSFSVQEAVSKQDSFAEASSAAVTSGLLDNLKLGMSEEDVIRLIGKPTNSETIGNNPKVPMEDWWYGDNQKVRIVNHQVNVVVKDVAYQRELMQQLMEAKKNKNDAEVERIMKELTKGIK